MEAEMDDYKKEFVAMQHRLQERIKPILDIPDGVFLET